MFKRFCLAALLAGLVFVTGCATTGGSQVGAVDVRAGVIEQITDVSIENNHRPGVGAVVGGLTGLGIGSLIGGGSGRDVAMVLGTVGGAVVGNEVQKRHQKPIAGQQIIVRLNNGVLVSVTQQTTNLHVGQKVYIQGSGEAARVTTR